MELPDLSLCLLSMLLLLSQGIRVSSISFELHSTNTKCVSEDVNTDVLVLGDYHVVDSNLPNGTHAKIFAKVNSPYGKVLHFAERVEHGQFGFTTMEPGDYLACFWMENVPKNTVLTVELDFKTGVAAKDWANIAKRDHIQGLELELRKLEDMTGSILDEMLFLRSKEEEMRTFNEVTHTRVAMFSVASILLCLMVAGLQSLHLKSFFERKKLL